MKILFDIVDYKLTASFFMLVLINEQNVKLIYSVICGIIFIGYNLHRWWIMHVEYKKRNKK